MIFNKYLVAVALSAGFFSVAFAQNDGGNGNQDNNNQGNQGNNAQAVLDPDNIQEASAATGQGNAEGVKAGQAESATDDENFINFCSGKTLTNGAQLDGGSCNGIPMGDIPATSNIVSTILTNPVGGCIDANKDFNVELQVANLNAGVFVNPTVAYYTAPQALQGGNVVGHVHVTIQALGDSLTPQQPLPGGIFAFFKGIDDDGDGNGGLTATVTGGLPPGFFRVCTMAAAANHQPVVMPKAQRGAQDDCVRFEVSENCDAGNQQAGNGQAGNQQNGNQQNGNQQNGNQQNGNQQNGNQQNGNQQNGNQQNGNQQNGNEQTGNEQNGNEQNGNEQNGNEQNGNEQNGNEQNDNQQAGNQSNGTQPNGNQQNQGQQNQGQQNQDQQNQSQQNQGQQNQGQQSQSQQNQGQQNQDQQNQSQQNQDQQNQDQQNQDQQNQESRGERRSGRQGRGRSGRRQRFQSRSYIS